MYWSPLVKVNHELGPVELCPGSHKQGIYPMEISDDKTIPAAAFPTCYCFLRFSPLE